MKRATLFESDSKVLAVPFAVVTGTFEELFFRKWLMDVVARHGVGVAAQVAVSGVVFGLAHAVWGLLGRDVAAAGKAMAFTGGGGGGAGCGVSGVRAAACADGVGAYRDQSGHRAVADAGGVRSAPAVGDQWASLSRVRRRLIRF